MNNERVEMLKTMRSVWVVGVWSVLVIAMVMATASSLLAVEKDDPMITTTYELRADGDKIGDISIRRRPDIDGDKTVLVRELTLDMEVAGFWGVWTMSSKGYFATDHQGLAIYDFKIAEDKKHWRIMGERHGKALWCSARQVLTPAEMDEKELAELAKSVATSTIPNAGTALEAWDLAKEGEEGGDIRIPLDSFDTSGEELPDFLWSKGQDFQQGKISVLDTVELEVSSYLVRKLGQKQMDVAGKFYDCRGYKAKTSHGEITFWIARDTLGAFIVNESGDDEDGPYEILLASYFVTP